MGFNDEISDMLNDDHIGKIVENSLIFKAKLRLDDKVYEYLSNAKNLKHFIEILAGGAGGGFAALLAWFATLGCWGKLLFFFSLVNPYTWVTIGAGLGIGAIFVIKASVGSADKALMHHIPKNITTPIDILGASVVDILCIPAIKLATCDGDYSVQEKQKIFDYFTKEWGISGKYIDKYQDAIYSDISNINYNYSDQIQKASKAKDFKYIDLKQLSSELIQFLEEIAEADGIIKECELKELDNIKLSFSCDSAAQIHCQDKLTKHELNVTHCLEKNISVYFDDKNGTIKTDVQLWHDIKDNHKISRDILKNLSANGNCKASRLLASIYLHFDINIKEAITVANLALSQGDTRTSVSASVIDIFAENHTDGSNVYTLRNAPDKKIANARFYKNAQRRDDNVYLYYDSTFFGSGDEGFILTDTYIGTNHGILFYSSIRTVSCTTSVLKINGEFMKLPINTCNFGDLFNFLQRLNNY